VTKTKLYKAIDNYVKSVRILLATITILPVLFVIGFFAPLVLKVIIFIPPAFILLWLLIQENAKIKEVAQWCDWMDQRLQSREYLDALLYLHYNDPTTPNILPPNLEYSTYLREKYPNSPYFFETYR